MRFVIYKLIQNDEKKQELLCGIYVVVLCIVMLTEKISCKSSDGIEAKGCRFNARSHVEGVKGALKSAMYRACQILLIALIFGGIMFF